MSYQSQNVYIENGYESRKEYLESLAEEYGVPLKVVKSFASMLGANEDFDGLLSELEDYANLSEDEEEIDFDY